MRKGLIKSYWTGVTDFRNGEKYGKILRYFFPEFITALVLYSLLYLLDAAFVAHLKSTSMYATLGITNTMLHFIVKFAEGISVGTIVLCGRFNGAGKQKDVGESLTNSFWITVLSGLAISSLLYFGAYWIYYFYRVPADMIELGVPFLRLRALGIFFMFIYFSFIGFMRGIKNTKTPMKIFSIGAIFFIFFDYVLIFGEFGFPKMGLQGSATASVIQYGVMLLLAGWTVFTRQKYKKYGIQLFAIFRSLSKVTTLLKLSWPVMLDKSTMALAYIWLGAMIAPMGKYALASFAVVKDLERFAFLPAVAFAQIITLLVSNDFGRQNWTGIKTNIKKIIFMASIMVFSILLIISIWPCYFVRFFDKKGDFTALSAQVIPILSVLVFFDLLQLILSGAMRGSANVKMVMVTRLLVCLGYFAPVSYILSQIDFGSQALKFILIYGSFYVGSAIMSLIYIRCFRSSEWQKQNAVSVILNKFKFSKRI